MRGERKSAMNDYTSRVEQILNGTFTGVPLSRVEALLIAWIQSGGGGGSGGTTNYGFLSNLPKINGVELRGDKSTADLKIFADTKLAEDLKATKAVGGIPAQKLYPKGTALEVILRDLLNPVENPTLTSPSASISSTTNKLLRRGTTTNATLVINFNRGTINPPNGTSGYRAGQATGYILNGGAVQSNSTFNVTVSETNYTFKGKVNYAAGEQPKNSIGEDFSTPLGAGEVSTDQFNFEFVNPIYSNARVITTIDEEQLLSRSAGIKTFNFPAQTKANPQVFDVPAEWNVTTVEAFNSITQGWQNASGSFDVSDVTHNGYAYKRYTDNRGYDAGARQVRFRWN